MPPEINQTNDSKGQIGLCGTKFLISVQCMDRAIAFYRDVIGLVIETSSPYWSELTFGTAIIALHGGGDGSFTETGLSFTVENIYTACELIVEGGGSIRSHPEDRGEEGIYLAMLTDTENNGFMVSQLKYS